MHACDNLQRNFELKKEEKRSCITSLCSLICLTVYFITTQNFKVILTILKTVQRIIFINEVFVWDNKNIVLPAIFSDFRSGWFSYYLLVYRFLTCIVLDTSAAITALEKGITNRMKMRAWSFLLARHGG